MDISKHRHGYPVYFEMELFFVSKRTLFLRELSAILPKDLKVAYTRIVYFHGTAVK